MVHRENLQWKCLIMDLVNKINDFLGGWKVSSILHNVSEQHWIRKFDEIPKRILKQVWQPSWFHSYFSCHFSRHRKCNALEIYSFSWLRWLIRLFRLTTTYSNDCLNANQNACVQSEVRQMWHSFHFHIHFYCKRFSINVTISQKGLSIFHLSLPAAN